MYEQSDVLDPRELGDFGEEIAKKYLRQCGFQILDRNWRCYQGEIDLVARDGDVLVIVEVKTRRTTRYGTPGEAVTAEKIKRLHRLAWLWRCDHRPEGCGGGTRVDCVGVLLPRHGQLTITHHRGLQ